VVDLMKEVCLLIRNEQYRDWLKKKLLYLDYDVHCLQEDQLHSSDLDFTSMLCIMGQDLLQKYATSFPNPILFVEESNDQMFHLALQYSCIGIIDPECETNTLKAVIELTVHKKKEYDLLNKENQKLTRKLQDRRIIDKAKLILMKRALISEEQAYERMRSEAMHQQKTLRVIADMILINEE
jgi:AmiR/NasT family two-component response regulator